MRKRKNMIKNIKNDKKYDKKYDKKDNRMKKRKMESKEYYDFKLKTRRVQEVKDVIMNTRREE